MDEDKVNIVVDNIISGIHSSDNDKRAYLAIPQRENILNQFSTVEELYFYVSDFEYVFSLFGILSKPNDFQVTYLGKVIINI